MIFKLETAKCEKKNTHKKWEKRSGVWNKFEELYEAVILV